ncbi:MAG: PA0069 family radical SAM protein [Usitatibacter sp.]
MPLKTTAGNHGVVAKGRGATINPEGRFEKWSRGAADDGWFQDPGDEPSKPKTVIAIEHAKSVISRHNSPDVGFAQSINPYRGCSHGCTYCALGSTLILMGDGRTLPLSELKSGDEIYGTKRIGDYRRYAKSRVLAHWSTVKPAYRLTLEDGTELVTSSDHRFLSDRGWKHVTGAESGRLRRPHLTTANKLIGTGAFAEGPADSDGYRRGYLCGLIRGDGHLKSYHYESRGRQDNVHAFRLALCDPQALLKAQDYLLDFEIATQEFRFQAAAGNRRALDAIRATSFARVQAVRDLIGWPTNQAADWSKGFLAGIFDAEGSLGQTVLRICNTDSEITGWISESLKSLGFSFVVEHRHLVERKPIDVVRLTGGLREQLRFFHTVRPAITRKLNLEGRAIRSDAKLRVVSIEPLGKAIRLYDITTETEDFIANGVVSHNCFARPSHAYLGLSPGIDFETRLFAKVNAAEKLREEIAKPTYRCEVLTIGVNTDAYQPIEREYKITRSILELAYETRHPVSLITKSALIERDIDLLAPMAKENLVSATLSVTTLDHEISRHMEPRTSAPARRLKAIERLAAAGIPVNVNVAPVIPFLTDSELEPILEAAAAAGAKSAGYVLMRLPWEVKDIFRAWLEAHFPLKAAHVMSRVHEMRGGRDNDPNFGTRMTGQGLFAEFLKQRFDKACRRLHLNEGRAFELDCSRFRQPTLHGQGSLF